MKNYGRRDKKKKPNPSGPVSFMDNVSSIFVGTVGLFYYRHRKRLSQKCASSLDGCIRLRAGFGFGSKYLGIDSKFYRAESMRGEYFKLILLKCFQVPGRANIKVISEL